ncbi:hypothetical protein FRC14_006329 [Serendipita sp. 396]|nr:hypothetical protein FRC14_006329 [Serendipita sp. 396]KAG8779969.1 hypothetical protein FRC15_009817 [Serendipita sp. 397]KAG8865631.1 hypothetical protein FRC20_009632 [Serendipita sp. 405]
MTSLFYQQTHPQVLLNNAEDVFGAPDASAFATLAIPAAAVGQNQAYLASSATYSQVAYQEQIAQVYSAYVQGEQPAQDKQADLNIKTLAEAGQAVTVPAETQKTNQEQIAALVNSRDREVTQLQTTLAMPLAHFNAKFIWHCIMNIERDCDPIFLEKIKAIHKTFYLPPAISFYALWLHFRFWDQMPQVYSLVEALLPPATASTSLLSKSVRVGIILYMMAASFANKHLDDFSYRNSSWYDVARMPAKDFLEIELLALKELQWSLEISSKDWTNWLLYLRTCNITLERTRPTEMNYHFVVARLIQDAIINGGGKDELLRAGVSGGFGRLELHAQTKMEGIKANAWHDTSPTLVPSSHSGSPPAFEGLHAHVKGNIAEGPFGLNALQRKLEMIQQNPEASLPKFIPWDTSLDPVVQVQSRSRSSSGSGARLGADFLGSGTTVGNNMLLEGAGAGCKYNVEGVDGRGHVPYGPWPRHFDAYGGYCGVPKAFGPGEMYTRPITCGELLANCGGSQFPLEYNGMMGTMGRPFKTCNAADSNLLHGATAHPLYAASWIPRL